MEQVASGELNELYSNRKYSIRHISRVLGIPSTTVYRRLIAYNIPMRHAKVHKGYKVVGGYILILKPFHPRAGKDGYVPEHILIWEQTHNKPLPEGWIVHHLNGVKDDNRPENLIGLPKRKHYEILSTKAERIRELEAKVKILERALEQNQILFVSDN